MSLHGSLELAASSDMFRPHHWFGAYNIVSDDHIQLPRLASCGSCTLAQTMRERLKTLFRQVLALKRNQPHSRMVEKLGPSPQQGPTSRGNWQGPLLWPTAAGNMKEYNPSRRAFLVLGFPITSLRTAYEQQHVDPKSRSGAPWSEHCLCGNCCPGLHVEGLRPREDGKGFWL